jgi:hypothetical protein
MPAITPRFTEGPVTFTVLAQVAGGQLVDGAAGGVQPSAAGSNVCVGVALTDALPASTSQVPTVPGAPVSVNLAPYPNTVAVANEGVYPLTYAAAATFGQRLITAANGQVAPAGAAPDARQVVGICFEPAGVALGAVGAVNLDIS